MDIEMGIFPRTLAGCAGPLFVAGRRGLYQRERSARFASCPPAFGLHLYLSKALNQLAYRGDSSL